MLLGVFDPFVKPLARQRPWSILHEVIGDSAFGGAVLLTNITAANWSADDACGRGNALFRTNPTSRDLTPPHWVSPGSCIPEYCDPACSSTRMV